MLLRRATGFVITPKGGAGTRDELRTFRKHLLWGLVFGVPLALAIVLGHDHASMRVWSLLSLAVCLLPVAIWQDPESIPAASPSRGRQGPAAATQGHRG